jgi:hypothetical protein
LQAALYRPTEFGKVDYCFPTGFLQQLKNKQECSVKPDSPVNAITGDAAFLLKLTNSENYLARQNCKTVAGFVKRLIN